MKKENPKIVKNYQSSLEESYLSIWKRHNRSKENIKNIEYLILKHMIMNKEDFEGYKKHIGSFINHNARDWARIIEQFYQENPGINLSFETILDEKSIKHYNISNNLLVDLKHIKNVISPTSEIKLKAWKDYGQKLSCHKHEIDLIEKYKKIKKGDKSLKILKEIGIMIINLNNRRMN
ncbi:hypothetical protein NPX79_00320 [Spiroplasma endosymbiont of Anurida maritima]|uniref:hypothetical protein n=1 Tax=Spiroplasma endosymbiont of Anurida maritima TaxID=2967972 RepID=UPI0036D3F24F